MVIAGLNKKTTASGYKLNDGGCCIIKNGEIVAIAEERLSRKKYDAGFDLSLKYCLDAFDLEIDDVDYFVVSSCCEKSCLTDFNINGVSNEKIKLCPSHHLSHAFSAFYTSDYDEALIIVIDNEGNVIDDDDDERPFYERKMEHMSYYVGNQSGIHLLEIDDVPLNQIGIGDAYRYFTHYLGFPSYEYAGKVMGLASYGKGGTFDDLNIFSFGKDGHIECNIKNDYLNPEKAVSSFLKSELRDSLVNRRYPIEDIEQIHADLAYEIQRQTEDILIKKINYLVDKTNIKNVCLCGGVALNSVANGKILRNSNVENLYIFPAAGDSGQCVGNAIYGYNSFFNKNHHFSINNGFLGKEYSLKEIDDELKHIDRIQYSLKEFDDSIELAKYVARLLNVGKYIGYFDGKSEIGPRALGHRSILANPKIKNVKDDLNNKIKFREAFRPFAPIVLNEKRNKYFDLNVESPYMLLVANVKKPDEIPAVTHVDNTARVQTIKESQNPQLYQIISEFELISGTPVLLNTSFNLAGEPIVETPQDAMNCFYNSNLDCIIIGNYVVEKNFSPNIQIDDYKKFICSLGKNLDC